MPYDSNADLPEAVRNSLPSHVQDIYRKAFNSAWEGYRDPEDRRGGADLEETAHRVAWSAVKQQYHKDGDRWVKN
jgi:cation transport regulator